MLEFLKLYPENFGLDISDLSLKIVKLKKNKGGFSIASFEKIDIEPGIIEKGVIQKEDALIKIIKAACKNVKGEKFKTKYVVASLPEERSFLQVIQMPNMKEEELKSAVIFEAENYIPLPVSEVYLDFTVVPSTSSQSNHLDVLIVAIPKKIANSYVSCLKKAGLTPAMLEVESEAIARALVPKSQNTAPIILIDFGKTSTVFIVFSGRSIRFTCSIPFFSQQITTVVAKILDVDMQKAEKIKMKFDLFDQGIRSEKIRQAIDPILEDLVMQIKKYMNFYQEHAFHEHATFDQNIQKILLCGGGASLKGLPEFLSKSLGVLVELGSIGSHIYNKNQESQVERDPLLFATAFGLALKGISDLNT